MTLIHRTRDLLMSAQRNSGLTQAEVAKRAGVSEQWWSDALNGKRRLTVTTARKLERVLDIDGFALWMQQAEEEWLRAPQEVRA